MKGFIEVTKETGIKVLVNINAISEVEDKMLYMRHKYGNYQDELRCEETYKELKRLIEEAVK